MPVLDSELDTLRENSHLGLRDALTRIRNEDQPATCGKAWFQAAYRLRALAICHLLLEMDTRGFQDYLCKSGYLRCRFLELVKKGLNPDPIYLCSSLDTSFVDALAAGYLDGATAIARLSPTQHDPAHEYEDDFLRFHFMKMSVLKYHAGQNIDLIPLTVRWREVLEGKTDPYLGVCEALAFGKEPLFGERLGELIEYRAAAVQKWQKDFSFDPEVRLVESYVFLAGLALLRVAELLGWEIGDEYAMMPAPARIALGVAPPLVDFWTAPDNSLP